VLLGERTIRFGAEQALIVSHELPVVSRITQASKENPYLALILGIDLHVIRSLRDEFGQSVFLLKRARSLEVGRIGGNLADALLRLVNASQDELDSMVLFDQISREVHFRLLQEPFGGMLRGLLSLDSHASRISKAISIIRDRMTEKISVPALAKSIGMSTSSFHHYFKQVTESTPLQYQKDL